MLGKLGDTLKETLEKITRSTSIDSRLIDELVRDIQRALLQADVNVKLVFSLTQEIKKRITQEETPTSVTKKEHLVNIVYEELSNFLGEGKEIPKVTEKTTMMLVGLFGSGKTTTIGKLAKYFVKRGKKVAVVQLDVWRPAAYEQLQQLAEKANATVFGNPNEKNPIEIYRKIKTQLEKFDVVLVDTAGRDALSNELIDEIKQIYQEVQPAQTLLVLSADIGQTAQQQATAFHDACGVNGVIITKLDGTAKAGGALSACAISSAPVMFIGIGEKIDEFELFEPKRFVGRLLGMGDITTLLEKVKESVDEETAEDLGKKFLKGEFNLLDLYEQMTAMRKMGPLSKIMELLPGTGKLKLPKEALDVQDEKIKKWRFAMDSMTKKELEEPDVLV